MSFSVSWHTLLEELDSLPPDAVLLSPDRQNTLQIIDTQEHRVIIEYLEKDRRRPLQREQFATLFQRVQDARAQVFALDRLPPDADPYAAVLSLHPRVEVDEDAGVIRHTEAATSTQLATTSEDDAADIERAEPDLQVYSDALLVTDALERHDMNNLTELESDVLVDLYTLLSDLQRSADELRKEISDVLLGRLHHDQPVSGQFGSVQRTARRQRSLKDDDTVLNALDATGIDRERVLSVDRGKVDDALDVTELSETDVYEVEISEYVRKADVDEETKETRLQGLKDRLAASNADDDEVQQLQAEIEALEDRIEDLTSFESGSTYHTSTSTE